MFRLMLFLAIALAGAAQGAPPAQRFDPRLLKGPQSGSPNALFVLGTPHLSGFPKDFPPSAVDLLIAKLRAWRPQAIGVEAMSGMQCDTLRHYPARYRDTVDAYCADTSAAHAATGLDVPAAVAEVTRLLSAWPAEPSASQRRHLAAVFLAAGEGDSALVQWLRLAPPERHAGDGLDDALVHRLERLRTLPNEVTLIAAPLAAQLGLERVYPIDDHSSDAPVDDEKAYAEVITRVWDNPASSARKKADDLYMRNANTPAGLLAMYRALNAPDEASLIFHSDFGAALEEHSPQRFGRLYVGGWETRNLRMASNIREIFAERPGIRALVIVGVSHKPYFDAYLNEMHDMKIVPAESVLK